MSKTLKLSDLTDKKACEEQVKLFKKLFGEELELTSEEQAVEIALEHYSKFNRNWVIANLLDLPTQEEYQKVRQLAWKEYEKVQQPTREEYRRIQQPAWREYRRIQQLAREEYLNVEKPAWKEYMRVERPAWKEYLRVERPAWERYVRVHNLALEKYQKVIAKTFATLWYNQ